MAREHYFNGTHVAIEDNIIPDLERVLKEFSPEMIVEFGTFRGGFVKYMATWFPEVPIYSVDHVYMRRREDEKFFRDKGNVTFIITTQLFRNEMILPILLAMPYRKFLFCDNGHKEDEVRAYSGYLRPGDLLGIHDVPVEVDLDKLAGVLGEFKAHPWNDSNHKGWTRLFVKRQVKGLANLPGGYDGG